VTKGDKEEEEEAPWLKKKQKAEKKEEDDEEDAAPWKKKKVSKTSTTSAAGILARDSGTTGVQAPGLVDPRSSVNSGGAQNNKNFEGPHNAAAAPVTTPTTVRTDPMRSVNNNSANMAASSGGNVMGYAANASNNNVNLQPPINQFQQAPMNSNPLNNASSGSAVAGYAAQMNPQMSSGQMNAQMSSGQMNPQMSSGSGPKIPASMSSSGPKIPTGLKPKGTAEVPGFTARLQAVGMTDAERRQQEIMDEI
jgi:hypothetical protein